MRNHEAKIFQNFHFYSRRETKIDIHDKSWQMFYVFFDNQNSGLRLENKNPINCHTYLSSGQNST